MTATHPAKTKKKGGEETTTSESDIIDAEWVRARSVTYRRAKEAEKCKGREYVVLFIVSDCCIVDQVETTQLIIDIS